MGLSKEHWDCVMSRAYPLLVKRKRKALVKELEDLTGKAKAAQKVARSARDLLEDEPNDENRKAFTDAHNAVQPAINAVEAKKGELEQLATPFGQMDVFRENWDTLSAKNLGAWCDAEELKEAEADLAEQEKAVAEAKAKLAERKRA